jgi:hypothetical protein
VDLPALKEAWRSMLSSKSLKTTASLPRPKPKKATILMPTHPAYYSLKPMVNTLSLKVSQPGLPSWWRLAAPQLNWVSAFVKHLSWALFVLSPSPVLVSKNRSLRVDWMATRDRLVTLTRGPMARKKKSRVQFVIPRRPLQLRIIAKTQDALELSKPSLGAKLKQVRAEEGFWLEAWPTPTTIIKSSLCLNINGLGFLVWR